MYWMKFCMTVIFFAMQCIHHKTVFKIISYASSTCILKLLKQAMLFFLRFSAKHYKLLRAEQSKKM